MRTFLIAACGAAFAVAASAASADESAIQLKPGPALEKLEANCTACHSLDYIPMNSPFLDEKGWQGEVTKMIKTYGAPIAEADAAEIAGYLSANYAKRQ